MKPNTFFHVLDIEETRDSEAVKKAYLSKVKAVNPEYDPQGFQQLREAYEEALKFCNSLEDGAPELALQNSPVELWIYKAEDIYSDFNRRIDLEQWEVLLQDSVSIEMEYSNEAKERMLRFLNEHFRLPQAVWKYINEFYQYDDNREEFYELCPKYFLDFLIAQADLADPLPYQLFEGDPKANYDLFIQYYFDLVNAYYNDEADKLAQIIEDMEPLGIEHPYYRALKAVLTQDWEAAVPVYESMLENDPKNYLANRILTRYRFLQGDYETAKKHCLTGLKIFTDEARLQELREINNGLLAAYQGKDLKTMDIADFLEMGWIYLQNGLLEEGLRHLDTRTLEDIKGLSEKAEFLSLYTRFYYDERQYDKTIAAAQKEKEFVDTCCGTLEDPKEQQNLEWQRRSNLEILARSYLLLGNQAQDDQAQHSDMDGVAESKKYYDEALKYAEMLLTWEPAQVGDFLLLSEIYESQQAYEKTIEYCNRAIELDDRCFLAFIRKQEACSKIWDGQGVIDSFYGAKQIFPDYGKMYCLAMEVFLGVEHLEDAQDIYNQAKEADIEDVELEIRYLKLRSRREDDPREIIKNAQDLLAHFQEGDPVNLAEIYTEMALSYQTIEEWSEAMESIEQAIKLHQSPRSLWIKGNIFLDMDAFKDALATYEECSQTEIYAQWTAMAERKGYCYFRLKDFNNALKYYREAFALDENNTNALVWIVDLYASKFKSGYLFSEKEEAMAYAEKAAVRELEYRDLRNLGTFYLNVEEHHKAADAYERAKQIQPERWSNYNDKGLAYLRINQLDLAEEDLQKAVEMCEDQDTIPHRNLQLLYQRREEYDKAIRLCDQIVDIATALIDKDKDGEYDWDWDLRYGKRERLDCYSAKEDYDKAIACVKELYTQEEEEYYYKMFEIMRDQEDYQAALEVLLDLYGKTTSLFQKNFQDLSRVCNELGELYVYCLGDIQKGMKYWKKSIGAAEGNLNKTYNASRNLMKVCFFQGDMRKAKRYQKMFFQSLQIPNDNIERYINYAYSGTRRLTNIVQGLICCGDLETAEYYIHMAQSKGVFLCGSCSCNECWEFHEALGMLCEAKNQKEEALTHYKKANEFSESSLLTMQIQRLTKEIEAGQSKN